MFDYLAFFIGFALGNATAAVFFMAMRAYVRSDTPEIWYCHECDEFFEAGESPTCKHQP